MLLLLYMRRRKHIFKFIQEAKQKGTSRDEIIQSLLDAGWVRSDVELVFDLVERGNENVLHVHFLHRHISPRISLFLLVGMVLLTGFITFYYTRGATEVNELLVQHSENGKTAFVYGSWPALENAQFFESVKQDFITQNASFIEADLSRMALRIYKDGVLVKETPIVSKGREGSWWETPAGLYKIGTMEKNHFSSFGNVYMPWSIQFQGNFFIHGWPYYPSGKAVAEGYSGGCVRLSDDGAEEIFKLAETGMPVLVFKESFENNKTEGVKYDQKKLLPGSASYIAADLQNNFVFAENTPNKPRSIASITKLMTALIAVEYINVEREVTINSSMIATTSIPRLNKGKSASILDLLSLLLVESSNEAALAIASPLGENWFVSLMNQKATAIGMENSRFKDTSGVLADNVSTTEDLFMLAKYLYSNRSFVLHMSMKKENRAVYGTSQFQNLSNLNSIPNIKGMVGGKTALSTSAKDSMLAVFEMKIGNEIRPITIIVLGSDDSKRDVQTLYHYIQTNFDVL